METKCYRRIKSQKNSFIFVNTHGSLQDPSIRDTECGSANIAIYYNSVVNFGVRKIGRCSRDFLNHLA
jgi:hypothetical protein